MIRVVLADDHPVVRSGYQRLLEQAGDICVVAEAGDGPAAYAACVEQVPDVLVTDLDMPGGGLELIRRTCLRLPETRVLVFSMHDSPPVVAQALQAGALGYVSKGSAPACLLDAICALYAGRRWLSPDLVPEQPDAEPEAQRLAQLNTREFETFRLLVLGHTVDDCAQALKLSPKTVSNHQTSIKEKLGVASMAALVHLAIRQGVIGSPRTVGA